MTLLLATGRTDGQNTFNKAVAVGTVRAETALPPDHRRSQRLFGGIVGRLDPLFAHKCPEGILMFEQLLTHPFGRITAPRPLRQEHVQRGLDGRQRLLQGRAVDRSFAEQVPQPKDQAAQCQEVCAPGAQAPTSVCKCLEIADQMRPAQLVPRGRQRQIRFMAIRPDHPGIGRSDQVAQGRPVPAGGHVKEGGDRRDHGPQPARFASFLPTRFVDIAAIVLLDGAVDLVIDRGQGGTPRLLQPDHAAEADGQAKAIMQQARQRPITEVILTVQDGDGGSRAWAKGTGGHLGRPLGRDEVAAPWAADGMLVVRGDLRTYDRQLPYILRPHRACIALDILQRYLAARAGFRVMIVAVVNVIGVGIGTVMRRMPRLTAGLPPAWHARRTWGCRWRVGRWRFGRVLGVLVELRFEHRDAGLEVGDLLLLVGNQLLLLCQNVQERANKLSHGRWGGSPVVWRDASGWHSSVHSTSMPEIGTLVKERHTTSVKMHAFQAVW